MTAEDVAAQGINKIRFSLLSAKVLAWVACRSSTDSELTLEAHLYFSEHYQRLADHHRRREHLRRADRLQAKADAHRAHLGDDGPPFAAAMGMPRPRRWLVTDAVSRTRMAPPKDAA